MIGFMISKCLSDIPTHEEQKKGFLLFIFHMVQDLLSGHLLSGLLFRSLCCLGNIHNLGLKPSPHVQVPCIHQLIDLERTKRRSLEILYQ